MSDLRWRDDGADPTIAELLESSSIDEPTPEALDRLRSRVAFLFTLPPGGTGSAGGGGSNEAGTSGTTSAAVSTTGGVVAKSIVAGAVALGLVGATIGLTRPEPSRLPQLPQTPVAVEPQAPPDPTVDIAPPPQPARQEERPTPPRKRPARPAPTQQPSQGDADLALLQKAMAASSPEQALSHAEQHRQRFPDSAMAQEREVIAIEALTRLHRMEPARARAEQFRSAWPTSTHLPRIDALLRAP